jgi:hypothetical protein
MLIKENSKVTFYMGNEEKSSLIIKENTGMEQGDLVKLEGIVCSITDIKQVAENEYEVRTTLEDYYIVEGGEFADTSLIFEENE